MNHQEVLSSIGLGKIELSIAPPKPPHQWGNVYYWWRRWKTHKSLPASASIDEKLKNGDFDVSPYWKQIEWEYYYLAEDIIKLKSNTTFTRDTIKEKKRELVTLYNRRIFKLTEDAVLDERARMQDLKDSIRRKYKGTKEQVHEYIENYAEGTIEECIQTYPHWLYRNA
jgi:hypothetical protein